ncbi:uncharacterized protein LOC125016050 [Mugil cephalus]|uniref:uncharacterized protein LOC125016050 n=1 Tax=Mugil cephalus TaxID=48193 RepID=UPI001FB61264|nr:uncharacterized protein LOC125016050 [Mugil cephalus]
MTWAVSNCPRLYKPLRSLIEEYSALDSSSTPESFDKDLKTMAEMTNSSSDDTTVNENESFAKLRHFFNIMSIIVYCLAFVLGVLGNGVVIWVTGFKMKKTVNTVWFLNLAVADFLFTAFLPLSVTYTAMDFHWPFGKFMCKLNSTVSFLNMFASVYILVVISVDRYVSVVWPIWAQNHRNVRKASFVSLAVWVLALILSTPYFVFRDTASTGQNTTACFNNFALSDDFVTPSVQQLRDLRHHIMIITRFLLGFVIPFTVIVSCYAVIIHRVRQSRTLASQSNRSFRIITAIIVTFFLCWAPYHILTLIELVRFTADDKALIYAVVIGIPIATSLAFLNSCLNPLLYVFMGRDFKDTIRKSILNMLETIFQDEEASSHTDMKSLDTSQSKEKPAAQSEVCDFADVVSLSQHQATTLVRLWCCGHQRINVLTNFLWPDVGSDSHIHLYKALRSLTDEYSALDYSPTPESFDKDLKTMAEMTNSSSDGTTVNDNESFAKLRHFFNIMSIIVYCLAFVLGVLGNGVVIWVTGFKMKKTVNTVWFLNLAVADFLFTAFLPFSVTYLAMNFHWPFGKFMCKLNSTVSFLNMFASVYILVVISVDRYVSVVWPIWAQNHRNVRKASFVSLAVWILALILSTPYFIFRDTVIIPGQDTTVCFNNFALSDDSETPSVQQLRDLRHHIMIITRFLLGFVIPFTVIVSCYAVIIHRLRRNRTLASQSNRSFKIITAIIITFFLCWAPYHILTLIELVRFTTDDKALIYAIVIGFPIATSLAFLNSCLNPLLYVFMGRDFKDTIRKSILNMLETIFQEEEASSHTEMKSLDTSQSKVKAAAQSEV